MTKVSNLDLRAGLSSASRRITRPRQVLERAHLGPVSGLFWIHCRRRCPARLRIATTAFGLLAMVTASLSLTGGCSTPYTERVKTLDEKYQQGEMSRADYMRFVHEAERWEDR